MHDDAPQKRRGGFTLVEIIVYLVILGVVGTVAANVFSSAIQAKIIVTQNAQVQLDMQRLVERVIDSVHKSVRIVSASSTLVLEMADQTKNPTIFAVDGSDDGFGNVTYWMTMKEGTSTPVTISPSTLSVISLSWGVWTNPAPSTSSVNFSFTGEYSNNGRAVTSTVYSLQTTVMPLQ